MTEKYTASPQPPKLLVRVRDQLRVKHYSIRTEQAYVDWIKRFIRFHGKRHPKDMGAPEIEAFLTHLAVKGKVAAAMFICRSRWTKNIRTPNASGVGSTCFPRRNFRSIRAPAKRAGITWTKKASSAP